MLLCLLSTQNNDQSKYSVHQNEEKCEIKMVILTDFFFFFGQNHATWKLIFRLYFLNRTFFSHFFFRLYSGVARAFPGGRLAHPEGQNEEENK